MSRSVYDDIRLFIYREKMHLTYEEALLEPAEEIDRAFLIWEMRERRDKLKS